jgi:hypothetical protein
MGKSSSTSFWETAVEKQVKNDGTKFPQKRLDKL